MYTTPSASSIQPPRVQAYVDTPNIVYTEWPEICGGIDAPLGSLNPGFRICVVGGGLTGCQAGANVTVLERNSEVGGRTLSHATADGVNFFERGAMRFPPSEGLTYYYAEVSSCETPLMQNMGFNFIQDFPDPGKVPTLLSFRGHTSLWVKETDIPKTFQRVHRGWYALVHEGVRYNGKQILPPLGKIKQLLQSRDPFHRGKVPTMWQSYLTTFKHDTFLSGLMRIFGPEHEWDVPGGEIWVEDEDIPLFGALGFGSGGFKALFGQNWSQLARLEANALEDNQATFAKVTNGTPHPAGIQDLVRELARRAEELGAKFVMGRRAIDYQPKKVGKEYETTVTSIDANGEFHDEVYDVVVVTTTTRTMNVAMSSLTDYDSAQDSVLPSEVIAAINNTSMISSSKVFLRTKKFWQGKGLDFPRVILSDTLASQLYTLDYGHPEYGVVLLVYVWGEDSEQLMGIRDKQEMLRILKARVANVTRGTPYSDYADYLEPITDEDIDITHWILEESALGAFALTKPGQDKGTAAAFHSPLRIKKGVYVGGDGVTFIGGWTEGGLMTGMNIISAVLKRYGKLAEQGEHKAPVNMLIEDIYEY